MKSHAWTAFRNETELVCSYGATSAQALAAMAVFIHDNYGDVLCSGVNIYWGDGAFNAETSVYEA